MPASKTTQRAWRPRRVAIIGLGRFGRSAAYTLNELGYEVTAVDIDERSVDEAAQHVALAAQGDGTDEELLRSLQIDQSDVGIVAQGSNLEASVMATLLLKRLEVPWVVSKAKSELHGELLRRIGADRVIFPEADAGRRLAHSLAVRHISDYISLSKNAGVAKLTAPAHFVGKSLLELDLEQHYNLNLLLIKRGQKIITVPNYREVIEEGDELLLVGPDEDMAHFTERDAPFLATTTAALDSR
ncbi:MAG TPA: TrkA family potassium uptake protein [Thermomicrobiales bacterium]|nr:TrkA family potassium uptake protein [Thermomicrobiales bacterium]